MGSDISEIFQTWEYVMSMNYQCSGHIKFAYKSQSDPDILRNGVDLLSM